MKQRTVYYQTEFPGPGVILARYTLSGRQWILTSYRWCIDGVRWTSLWRRIRSHGTRQIRRGSQAGVAMSIADDSLAGSPAVNCTHAGEHFLSAANG